MKILNSKIWIVALASLAVVACSDMDTKPFGSTVTSEQKADVLEENPDRAEASVTGIATMFNVCMTTTGDHNDFGYPALMLHMDSRGMDLVGKAIGYNWFSGAVTMQTDWDINGDGNILTWYTLYNQIYTANEVAKTISLETQLSKDGNSQLRFFLAQALAIRAFDYFHLAQVYQQTYVGHESNLCVPVITDENADEAAANGCARATVQDTYDQILTDLNNAIALLEQSTYTRSDRRYVDLATAYGLRARVHLVMNKWTEAKADAEAALKATDAVPLTMKEAGKPGFNSLNANDIMWGILVAETDRSVTSGIVNFPSHMGSLNYGYASAGSWRYVNKDLYNQIPTGDCRKGWFMNSNGKSGNLSEQQQAYATSTKVPAYAQVKFAPYQDVLGQDLNASDIPLMRVEEMYLIQAEATAMAGDVATACSLLEKFVKTYRNPYYSVTATTAEEVQNACWLQRRIEFWGEGISYFDLMRLKKGVDRRGAGFETAYIYHIEPEDAVLIYQIPKRESETNKLIGNNDLNPNAKVPDPVNE